MGKSLQVARFAAKPIQMNCQEGGRRGVVHAGTNIGDRVQVVLGELRDIKTRVMPIVHRSELVAQRHAHSMEQMRILSIDAVTQPKKPHYIVGLRMGAERLRGTALYEWIHVPEAVSCKLLSLRREIVETLGQDALRVNAHDIVLVSASIDQHRVTDPTASMQNP